MKNAYPPRRSERGTVLVMVALWLPLVVLMLSLVVNVGHWFEHRRHLQVQADAAALAGGDLFGACFNGGGGDAAIFGEATKYGGSTAQFNGSSLPYTPLYNFQVGGTKAERVAVLYQSRRFANESANTVSDPTAETQAPCETPSLMFDVKATESDLPWFLTAGTVKAINAQARVQLRGLNNINPSLPLAVPDVNPRQVGVTFVNEATGAEISGCSGPGKVTGTTCTFSLTKGAPAGGLNMWSGLASITVPAVPAKVGVRIGLGGQVGSCANTGGTATYTCFDGASTSTGLTMIRSYAVSAPAPPVAPSNMSAPVLEGVWPTSCSGNGAFYFITTGTCTSGVTAEVNYGTGSVQPGSSLFIRATVGSTTLALRPVAFDSARNSWVWALPAGTSFALPAQAGAQGVSLAWEVQDTTKKIGGSACTAKNNNPCKGNFVNAPQQRFYSGTDNFAASGPIRSVQITGGTDVNGPASLVPGSSGALNISIGVAGSYGVHTPCSPPPSGGSYTCFASDRAVLLRLKQDRGPNTYTVDCGGKNIRDMIENGCSNRYGINSPDVCPDPANPSPPDCVPVQTGTATGQIRQGMNNRFSNPSTGACYPNSYPTVVPGDPRVVIVMVTDFSAFSGGGGNLTVPIVTYGAFYVVGWDGAAGSCNNEPYSNTGNSGSSGTGDVWGHFIKYVPTDGTGGSGSCDLAGLLPCVPVLTR